MFLKIALAILDISHFHTVFGIRLLISIKNKKTQKRLLERDCIEFLDQLGDCYNLKNIEYFTDCFFLYLDLLEFLSAMFCNFK